jgi:hypothetical protein
VKYKFIIEEYKLEIYKRRSDFHFAFMKGRKWMGIGHKVISNWSLGFCEGESCTDNYPTEHQKLSVSLEDVETATKL